MPYYSPRAQSIKAAISIKASSKARSTKLAMLSTQLLGISRDEFLQAATISFIIASSTFFSCQEGDGVVVLQH